MTITKSINFRAMPALARTLRYISSRREEHALMRAREMQEQEQKLMWITDLRMRISAERAG